MSDLKKAIDNLHRTWLSNMFDPGLFIEYVKYIQSIGLMDEPRVLALYSNPGMLSVNDWPNIASCALGSCDDLVRHSAIRMLSMLPPAISIPSLTMTFTRTESMDDEILVIECLAQTGQRDLLSFFKNMYANAATNRMREALIFAIDYLDVDSSSVFLAKIVKDDTKAQALRHIALSCIGRRRGMVSTDVLKSLVLAQYLPADLQKQAFDLYMPLCSDIERSGTIEKISGDYNYSEEYRQHVQAISFQIFGE